MTESGPTATSPEQASNIKAEESWWRKIEEEFPPLSRAEADSFLAPKNGPDSGQLIGYRRQNAERFPRFQFDFSTGAVLPVIQDLLAITRGYGVPDKDLILWMVSSSTLFKTQDRPVDHLGDPEILLAAAGHHFGAIW